MIKLTRSIKITVTEYKPQFDCKTYRRSNSKFYTTRVCLKEMYLIKYKRRIYKSFLSPFKAEVTSYDRQIWHVTSNKDDVF